jgi:amidohydrolase
LGDVLPVPDAIFAKMVRLRRDLHRHPELSGQEQRTAQVLQEELAGLGLTARRVAETGLVVDLPGPAGVPIVALRADTDALPIHEETGLEFSSCHDGVMHACGHDGHSSMLIGAAAILRNLSLAAPLRLLWQPAEENATGATALIAAGCLEGVGMIFGGHLDRRYPAGHLVVTDGAVNASTDAFTIDITGQDAHGARPHLSTDTVVVGSGLVMALQTIVSREINPAHPAVVTVGSFHAGQAPNVIAGHAQLRGTIRAQDPLVRQQLHEAVRRIAECTAKLHGAQLTLRIEAGSPPLLNPARATRIARTAARSVAGEDHVGPLACANMGGEDFAFFLRHVPGCYIRFGGRIPNRESFPAHSSRFDFDETAMAVGAAWFVEVAQLAAQELASEVSKG